MVDNGNGVLFSECFSSPLPMIAPMFHAHLHNQRQIQYPIWGHSTNKLSVTPLLCLGKQYLFSEPNETHTYTRILWTKWEVTKVKAGGAWCVCVHGCTHKYSELLFSSIYGEWGVPVAWGKFLETKFNPFLISYYGYIYSFKVGAPNFLQFLN